MLKLIRFFFAVVFFFAFPAVNALAADFESTYKVVYELKEQGNSINSKANFQISITNNRSDVYVNKFAISFPKSFAISNLKVKDDNGEVEPIIETSDNSNKISMEFNNPNIGRGSVNNFHVTFEQANLFKVNGNVWEVILPVIENRDNSRYDVTVLVPDTSKKKITIAKPAPTSVNGREIKWSNPTTKTIYAVFGDSQLYRVNLAYHLRNHRFTPTPAEIAFPPDTLYQKITLASISEEPAKTYQDEDGNYLGVYNLKPRETKNINAEFVIEVFPNPREEAMESVRNLFQYQSRYLLNTQKYWELKSIDKIANLKTNNEIYNFVTDTLDYSYQRVNKDNVRLGAEAILQNPSMAVCMEFTDLYVAASREKGIYSREIEGYGASSDPQLRPLSLSSDVLHAWPEYYDQTAGIWRPVDPTWEKTSGIDYFNSFDLNHIVFAIHGKRADYPLPAGMYKLENSKDIEVTAITSRPEEREELSIVDITIPSKITDNKIYKGRFMVKNFGNVYMWNIPVKITAAGLTITNSTANIMSLAPGEKREIAFEYQAPNRQTTNVKDIKIYVSNHELLDRQIVVSSFVVDLSIMIAGAVVAIAILALIVRKFRS